MKNKRILSIILAVSLFFLFAVSSYAAIETDAKSVILIEANTGKVLYEDNADEALPPASVTKIMTMLLVLEAVDNGSISLDDMVSVSANAASMGGSQVYLEVGETMSVDEMLKCVAVASANDAAVALAEYVAGSEEAFVEKMNKRAKELGMNNTSFENTNGLDDTAENHLTSARDIAIMSAELLKHEQIFKYTNIWMDTVRDGKFGLTNTNKLIRFYQGANGLKTGSTSKAGFCISATALRDNMQLIAVIMGSKTRDGRNSTATKLLDYGFANYSYLTYGEQDCDTVRIRAGKSQSVSTYSVPFEAVINKSDASKVTLEAILPESLDAPICKGDVVGKIVYKSGDEIIGESEIKAAEDVEKVDILFQFKKIFDEFLFY